LKGQEQLLARRIEVDEASAKAALYNLNCHASRPQEIEEAWIVHALVRDDGLSQVEVGQLLGRHKSWVNRRLAMLERLAEPAVEELRLGLLPVSLARQLVRLPVGNQVEALSTARNASLTSVELRGVVDLLNLFSYVLGYSRRQYLCFTEQQDFDTTVRQHVCAFEYLDGVAATCLYDNMKVVVQRWEDDQPLYNTRFLAFATHYGYRPVACLPRRAQTKEDEPPGDHA
jgi:hypothetical protein